MYIFVVFAAFVHRALLQKVLFLLYFASTFVVKHVFGPQGSLGFLAVPRLLGVPRSSPESAAQIHV